ncbi:MAG: universal stress protein [Methanobacteriota archaeon]
MAAKKELLGMLHEAIDFEDRVMLIELEEEAGKIRALGLDVETRLELGDPAEEIGADMIVLGVRGVSTWKKILLGSVSERVLNETKIPVFIVR